jgi:hypothetical protein
LPLLAVVIIALLAVGVLVFRLAFSTSLATEAQTAADAAALAGENEVVRELQSPRVALIAGPQCAAPVIDPGAVQTQAEYYAEQNGGRVLGQVQIIQTDSGCDVLVTVQSIKGLPSGNVDAGEKAVRQARASTDPLSSSSPPPVAPTDASLGSGPRFVAGSNSGSYGFFPDATANYSVGYEPEIAGRLNQLAIAHHLHLEGLSGYRTSSHSVEVGGTADDPHTCGAASDTPGVEGVPESTLEQYGLTRPFPNDPHEADHIQLAGTTGSVCLTGVGGANGTLNVDFGNPNVHLVPLSGGPQGALGFPSLGASAGWAIPWQVVSCESGGRNTGPNSATASGYYQITDTTWADFGGYAHAYLAPKSVQDAKARQLIQTRGLEPWTSSEGCWGHQIGLAA